MVAFACSGIDTRFRVLPGDMKLCIRNLVCIPDHMGEEDSASDAEDCTPMSVTAL